MGLDNGPAGPAWLASENIEVEISQLDDFAKAIEQELSQNFKPSFQQGIVPMLAVHAPFGQGNLAEGKFFGGQHKQSSDSLELLMRDTIQGLTSLQMAARSIAAEYRSGDAMSEASMTDVMNGFLGKEGEPTLRSLQLQNQQSGGTEAQGDIPPQAQNPGAYFEDKGGSANSGQAFDIYDPQTVAEGQSGEYYIGGDDEGVTDPSLDVNPDFKG